jgi:hypothetical protein
MTRSATRRAVPAGWLERVFSKDAQTKFLHHKRGWRGFGALFIFGNTNAISETKPPDKPPLITGR